MGTLERLPGITRRKVGTTSNHHAPYDLGYTRATMAVTEGSEAVKQSKPQKGCLSSDCSLQLDYMKLESLVIANQNVADRKGGAVEGRLDNWGEVVTR